MIIKLQAPLATNSTGPELWFAYARDHRHEQFILKSDVPEHARRALSGVAKAYFEADLTDDGKFVIGRKVSPQNW
jgi:hypothetical protein